MKIRNFIKNDFNKLKLFNSSSFFTSFNMKNFSTIVYNNNDKYSTSSYLNVICDINLKETNDSNLKYFNMQKNFLHYNINFDYSYSRLNDKILNQEKFNENEIENENENNHLTNFKEINHIQRFNMNNNEIDNVVNMNDNKNESKNVLNFPELEMLGKKKKMAKKKRAKRKYDRDINVRYR